jgi:NAD-dependent protein deacetylase/lipoamidase
VTADAVDLPEPLLHVLPGRKSLVVLTGAGMSAECGIPVFRGPGGLWEGFRPEELATPEAFQRDPERVWRWYRWRLDRVTEAAPHAGYEALAALERDGGLDAVSVITQNVDGMHRRAGSTRVLELHGNLTRARCDAGCGKTVPAGEVDPSHSGCVCGRGRLRPDVVWFGETLNADVVRAAFVVLEDADLIWVVGTSGMVNPAALLPLLGARKGIPVVEVNPVPTPLSRSVTFSLRAPASESVVALCRALRDQPPPREAPKSRPSRGPKPPRPR